jgi:cysteinyl-tRNA synthetase
MAWAKLVHDAPEAPEVPPELVSALSDDLNTPAAMAVLHELAGLARKSVEGRAALRRALSFLGLYGGERFQDFAVGVDVPAVEALVVARNAARKAKDFAGADQLKLQLKEMGVEIEDGPQGTTWRLLP